jgi:quinol monooxygenase YgiN
MVTKALLVHLDARHGMETAVEEILLGAVADVRHESATRAWFALRFGRGEYGIFDAFPDEAGREAHLRGPVATTLTQRAAELFTQQPSIEKLDVLASKLPLSPPATADAKGLLLNFKPKAGHVAQVEQFLLDARTFVVEENGTTAWFAIRHQNGDYGIFDVFPDNGARFAHLTGHVPRELAKHSLSLLGGVPDIHMLNVLAENFQV